MARTGLTACDPERACPGYTLYAPMSGSGEVYLLDINGEVAHRWQMPYPPGLYGYLLPNGNLFYGGQGAGRWRLGNLRGDEAVQGWHHAGGRLGR